MAAAALFLSLLVALHVFKPEVDPSWRMISDYELGRYGFVMVLAFVSLRSAPLVCSSPSGRMSILLPAPLDSAVCWPVRLPCLVLASLQPIRSPRPLTS